MGCMSEEWGLNLDRSRGQSHGDQHQQKPGRKDVEKNLVHSILFFSKFTDFLLSGFHQSMVPYHGEIPWGNTRDSNHVCQLGQWLGDDWVNGKTHGPMDLSIARLVESAIPKNES